MNFAERMQDIIDKSVAGTRDLAHKAGDKAKELAAKGVKKVEIMQLEGQAAKLIAKLGSEAFTTLSSGKQAVVSRETPSINEMVEKIEGLRAEIELKEKEYHAIGEKEPEKESKKEIE
jgi:uncharacterized protein YlzI (FlbEa/FlbD family)